jgi:hypothetical protein
MSIHEASLFDEPGRLIRRTWGIDLDFVYQEIDFIQMTRARHFVPCKHYDGRDERVFAERILRQ